MQTAYAIDIPAVTFPGQPVDLDKGQDCLSALAVAAAMDYGVLGVSDEANVGDFSALAVRVPAAAADITALGKALGVVVADQARAQDPSVATAQYPIKSAVSLMRRGRIWVKTETAVADGGDVYVRFAANGGATQLGAFRNDADTTAGPVDHAAKLPGATFRGTTGGAGFAVVELTLV